MANRTLSALVFFAVCLPGAPSLRERLKQIEQRYNSTASLAAHFEQIASVPGGGMTTEEGQLLLEKPGKMRWTYARPQGKLFVCDGKTVTFVSPASRRVEISPMKQTEDIRIPLAFLLGKLDFERDFDRFEQSTTEGSLLRVRAFPKNQKTFIRSIDFTAEPDGRLSTVAVDAKDGTTMTYKFSSESRNPPIRPHTFEVQVPDGFEVQRLAQ